MTIIKRLIALVFEGVWFILAGLVIALLLGHLWFVNNSEKALENTIKWGSNGKLSCSVKKFSINYFSNVINIEDIAIFNTDSTAQETFYKVSAHQFHLRIKSKWDLIFHSQLLIDSVIFNNPEIEITRTANRKKHSAGKKILLVQELGKLYKTINNSLEVLNLDLFEIREGTLIVKEAGNTKKNPLKINHIYFTVNKLSINAENLNDKSRFHFSESIKLKVDGQNIMLPDNQSSIAFKEFLIDTKDKMVRITDPKLNILPTETQKNSLDFSAKRLSVLGLDFNALYLNDLLKVDSFFLESPKVDLDFFRTGKNKSAAAKRIKIDSFIDRLPIGVNIRHIVMQQCGLTIRLHKAGKTTAFSTKNDDISISNFHLHDQPNQEIGISGFKYTIRHYVGFSSDSTYRFDFDSLQLINNKIILYNLQVATANKTRATLFRNYVVPRFEITDFDWLSFILDNHLIANEAMMYDPVLNLEKNLAIKDQTEEKRKKKKSVYEIISLFDKIIALDRLQIINGAFNYKQSDNLNAHIQKLNLNIYIKDLGKAKTPEDLVRSFQNLSFDTATVNNTSNFLSISKSVLDIKKQKLAIQNLHFDSENSNISMSLKGVEIQDFLIDSNILDLNTIYWKSGVIHINGLVVTGAEKPKTGKVKSSEISINNITGNNTALYIDNEKFRASVYLKVISADHLHKEFGKPVRLDSLWVAGNHLRLHLPNGNLWGGDFLIRDKELSAVQNLVYIRRNNGDSLNINIPMLRFIPDITQIAQKEAIILDQVKLEQPKFYLHTTSAPQQNKQPLFLPPIEFKHFLMKDANINLQQNRIFTICDQCTLKAENIVSSNDSLLYFKLLQTNINDFSFHKNDSLEFEAPGKTIISADYFSYAINTRQWEIQHGKFESDSLSFITKQTKTPQSFVLKNLQFELGNKLQTADMGAPLPWLMNQSDATIRLSQLHWQKEFTNLTINNLAYKQYDQTVRFDTFSFDPGYSRIDFLNAVEFKKDFIRVSAGQTAIRGLSLTNKTWSVTALEADNILLQIYSDKIKKPRLNIVKPMPASFFRKIALPFRIDSVYLHNASIHSTELNRFTKDTGTVYFTAINGLLNNVRTISADSEDSLKFDLHARFLDTYPLDFVMHESLTDSLGGLSLQLRAGPGAMNGFNSFFPHLSPFYIKSGVLDSFCLTAVANDYTTIGNTMFYYHDLKVVMKPETQGRRPKFKNSLLNFFGNSLIVRDKNSKRSVPIGFSRRRNKSAVSFLVKMITDGINGTVSPLGNKVYKRYRLKHPLT
ncbi:MAG: hypothetical protein WCR52_01480 [Bacteroidota bacterium]